MPDLIQSDITIIGAGPAGLTAAMALAKQGIPCLVIDKHHFPRPKICGDGLSGKVVSILKKLDPDYVTELSNSGFATGSHSARFYSPATKMMELAFQREPDSHPAGFICKRADFDEFLFEKAMALPGIHFLGGKWIGRLNKSNGLINVEDQTGKPLVQSRLVLLASGNDKSLALQLDRAYPTAVEEGIGVRGYFDKVTGSDHNHAIEIHFLKELLPWYLWIFPFADGSANVGLALPESLAKKSALSLKELLIHLIKKYPHLEKRFEHSSMDVKIEANRLPFFTGPVQIAGDNYMFLGDTARLIDPFTGEGMGNAMASGYMAAEVAAKCMENNDFSNKVTREYEQVVYKKLGADLATGLKLQRLARRPELLNLVIGKASANEKTREMISEMLYNTEAKNNLSKSSFYLKLLIGL
jgi:geranylgeranyl reductase family protein